MGRVALELRLAVFLYILWFDYRAQLTFNMIVYSKIDLGKMRCRQTNKDRIDG